MVAIFDKIFILHGVNVALKSHLCFLIEFVLGKVVSKTYIFFFNLVLSESSFYSLNRAWTSKLIAVIFLENVKGEMKLKKKLAMNNLMCIFFLILLDLLKAYFISLLKAYTKETYCITIYVFLFDVIFLLPNFAFL